MPPRRPAMLLALSLFGLHCTASDGGAGEATSNHTAGSPINVNSPYSWAVTDYTTWKQIAQRPPFSSGPALAPEVITKRLQVWADRVDGEVRKDVKARTGSELAAPKPIVVIVPSKVANAWVSGVPSCMASDADLSGVGKADRSAKTASLVFVKHAALEEAFSLFGGPPPSCATPTNWPTPDAVSFFSGLGSSCNVTEDGGSVKVTGDHCALYDGGPTRAAKLTYYATSPYVHITSAIVAASDTEEQMVSVLSHELGHYYRAHAIAEVVMAKFNYFYERKDPPDPTTPGPAADAQALEAQFHRVMPYPLPIIAGQQLSYRLTSTVVGSIAHLLQAANATSGFACKDAVADLGEWRSGLNSVIPDPLVRRATRDAYLAYEAALLACAPKVPVTEAGGEGALKLSEVRDAIHSSASAFADPPVGEGTLADVLSTLQDRAAPLDREADEFYAAVKARRLGRYTSEQEADEFSLEYFARVGLDPKLLLDANLASIGVRAASDAEAFQAGNGGLDFATCKAMYEADWRDASADGKGELVFVPLGNINEPHHGECYRLFNLSQEQRAHQFVASGSAPTFDGAWSEVQADAKKATDAYQPPWIGGGLNDPAPAVVLPAGGVIVDGI